MSNQSFSPADRFLSVAKDFRLGDLPTEQRHPHTTDLSSLAHHDLPKALSILKQIDVGVIADVVKRESAIMTLRSAIRNTIDGGGRIFFYGCGATGRLSLSIENIWRTLSSGTLQSDQVMGFMSGGDLALIHSIENFEDHPEYGARQLKEIGFSENDLLVCSTEGGETPSVIGAIEAATGISKRKPFFLYCNPDLPLRTIDRSRRVLDNPAIEKLNLYVGPMALSGSTRLQASTALMLAAGSALMDIAAGEIEKFQKFLEAEDLSFLADFIKAEAEIYNAGDFILYETRAYGMTILTDTTERSPTFSLAGFENQNDQKRIPALSYLCLLGAENPHEAWKNLLLRDPVTIEWDELKAVAGHKRIMGFDFSENALEQRTELVAPSHLHRFYIDRHDGKMVFALSDLRHEIDVSGFPLLLENILLKIILNMHSTLVMGRLGRYESNIMTWVKPSNYKLIDRAIRYVDYLLSYKGISSYSYDDICYALFNEIDHLKVGESIVLNTVKRMTREG